MVEISDKVVKAVTPIMKKMLLKQTPIAPSGSLKRHNKYKDFLCNNSDIPYAMCKNMINNYIHNLSLQKYQEHKMFRQFVNLYSFVELETNSTRIWDCYEDMVEKTWFKKSRFPAIEELITFCDNIFENNPTNFTPNFEAFTISKWDSILNGYFFIENKFFI